MTKHLAGLTRKQRDFVRAIERNTGGLKAVSTGACPGCEQCRDEYAHDSTMEQFSEQCRSGEVINEGFFSWHGCDLCGSSIGGTFQPWHGIDSDGAIIHGERACVDCVCYLANGDLPGGSFRRLIAPRGKAARPRRHLVIPQSKKIIRENVTMKRFDELTDAQQNQAVKKCVNLLLKTIVEGAIRFNDAANNDNLQARIDAAWERANAMQTPWFAHEYIMETCREEIEGMARCTAEDSLYPGPEENVLSGIVT